MVWFKPWARFITFFVGPRAGKLILPIGIPSEEAFGRPTVYIRPKPQDEHTIEIDLGEIDAFAPFAETMVEVDFVEIGAYFDVLESLVEVDLDDGTPRVDDEEFAVEVPFEERDAAVDDTVSVDAGVDRGERDVIVTEIGEISVEVERDEIVVDVGSIN